MSGLNSYKLPVITNSVAATKENGKGDFKLPKINNDGKGKRRSKKSLDKEDRPSVEIVGSGEVPSGNRRRRDDEGSSSSGANEKTAKGPVIKALT